MILLTHVIHPLFQTLLRYLLIFFTQFEVVILYKIIEKKNIILDIFYRYNLFKFYWFQ